MAVPLHMWSAHVVPSVWNVLSLLHITATETFQKPELVSSAYSLQKPPLVFRNLILASEALHDLANSSHLLSFPALPT